MGIQKDEAYKLFCVMSFGLTCGLLWAGAVFAMGIIAIHSGYGKPFVHAIGSLYLGYDATMRGAIAGALWAFFDACVGGLVFAWLYNSLSRLFRRICHRHEG